MSDRPLDLAILGRTLRALLEQGGKPVIFRDRASGQDLAVDLDTVASPTGLLPAFLAAGAAVWREATGKELGVEVAQDPAALLGYRVRGVRGSSFSAVMLSVMEATSQVTGPEAVLVNDLGALWNATTRRMERGQCPTPRAGAGPSP